MSEKHKIGGSVDVITSRQNPIISMTAKLSDKKHRDLEGLFLLDGIKLMLEAASSPLTVEYVIIREDVRDLYYTTVHSALPEAKIYVVSPSAFDRVTDEKAPQGVVTAVRYSDSVKREGEVDVSALSGISLLFDGVQNPDNFGAIIRSARAFGVKNVICGNGCADIYGRRVMRASMGAALHIGSTYVGDVVATCRKLADEGGRIIATLPSPTASSLFEFSFRDGDVIVIGNEGHGISDAVIAVATDMLYIPMAEGQESLNAASAAAVILYEVYRQKH